MTGHRIYSVTAGEQALRPNPSAAGGNARRLVEGPRTKSVLSASLLTMSMQLLVANGAHAQAAQPPAPASATQAQPPEPTTAELKTVVVSAEKRTTNVQSTPIAVDVVGQDTLAERGVISLLNIDQAVPAMAVTRAAAGLEIDIRGIEALDTNPTAESPNSLYIDGAVIAHATGYDGLLFDVNRVEVLEGPQGTLYGRNSNGGAVDVITNRPTEQYSVDATVETGSYNLINTSGAVNLPLTDTLAARVAFLSYSHDGYFASGLDDADQHSARVELQWTPDDRQSLLITSDLEKIGGKGSGGTNVIGFVAPPRYTGPAAYVSPNPWNDTHYDGPDADALHYDTTNVGVMAEYDYSFDFAKWTTQIAHRQFDAANAIQGSVGGLNLAPSTFNSDTFESRLASTGDKSLQWLIGAYGYLDHESGTLSSYATQNYLPPATPALTFGDPSEHARSWAIFGQTTYTPDWLDHRLHLTLGGRHSADYKNANVYTLIPKVTSFDNQYRGSWSAFTDRETLGYDVLPNSLLYITRATGYEAGGFAYGTTPEFQPEYITDYEIGSKNRFFDNKLQVNFEGFYYHYRNFEAAVIAVYDGIPSPTVTNAGAADYRGESVDIEYVPTDSDILKFSLANYWGRYGQFNVSAEYPGIPSYTDENIPGIPEWTGNFSYDHIWNMLGGSFDGQMFVRFRGEQLMNQYYTHTPNAFYLRSSPWATLDFSLQYEKPGSSWSVTGYVRNATNRLIPVTEQYDTSGRIYASFDPPRTVGVRVSVKLE